MAISTATNPCATTTSATISRVIVKAMKWMVAWINTLVVVMVTMLVVMVAVLAVELGAVVLAVLVPVRTLLVAVPALGHVRGCLTAPARRSPAPELGVGDSSGRHDAPLERISECVASASPWPAAPADEEKLEDTEDDLGEKLGAWAPVATLLVGQACWRCELLKW